MGSGRVEVSQASAPPPGFWGEKIEKRRKYANINAKVSSTVSDATSLGRSVKIYLNSLNINL
jgi:hypothetical protein